MGHAWRSLAFAGAAILPLGSSNLSSHVLQTCSAASGPTARY